MRLACSLGVLKIYFPTCLYLQLSCNGIPNLLCLFRCKEFQELSKYLKPFFLWNVV